MTQTYKKGDQVVWKSGQGETTGTVEEYITQSKQVEGQTVAATEDDPRYLVKNDHTGNVTGHKPDILSPANEDQSKSSQKSQQNSSDTSNNLQPGDTVEWNTAQGKTKGEIVEKLTSETQIKGHTVKASKDNPEYLVRSDKTGKKAAHKPDSLSKV